MGVVGGEIQLGSVAVGAGLAGLSAWDTRQEYTTKSPKTKTARTTRRSLLPGYAMSGSVWEVVGGRPPPPARAPDAPVWGSRSASGAGCLSSLRLRAASNRSFRKARSLSSLSLVSLTFVSLCLSLSSLSLLAAGDPCLPELGARGLLGSMGRGDAANLRLGS